MSGHQNSSHSKRPSGNSSKPSRHPKTGSPQPSRRIGSSTGKPYAKKGASGHSAGAKPRLRGQSSTSGHSSSARPSIDGRSGTKPSGSRKFGAKKFGDKKVTHRRQSGRVVGVKASANSYRVGSREASDRERLAPEADSLNPDLIYGRHPVEAAIEAERSLNRLWVNAKLHYDARFRPLILAAKANGAVIDEVDNLRLSQMT